MHFKEETLSLRTPNKKIYSSYVYEIRDLYFTKKAKAVLSKKFECKNQEFLKVDWRANQRVMQMLHKTKQIWISKYITGFLPIGVNMERRDEWKQTHCPRCACNIETRHHIMKCTETTSVEMFQKGLEDMQEWLCKMDTPKELTEEILLNTTLWHAGLPPIPVHESILSEQMNIGRWDHFMEGRIHVAVVSHLNKHYEDMGSRRTGELWASQLIVKIWNLFYFKAWELRNKFVHNRTEKTKISRQREDLQHRVRVEYGDNQR